MGVHQCSHVSVFCCDQVRVCVCVFFFPGPFEGIKNRFHIARVVKFRRTGESSRSDEDAISGEHEIRIEGVQAQLEAAESDDGGTVPREFANPTDGES